MTTDATDPLLALLRKRCMLLFVGAGLSVDLGYPAWTPYLAQLEAALGAQAPLGLDALDRAQWIKDEFTKATRQADYLGHIQRTFAPREASPYSKIQTALIRLRFRGVVTTNYDPSLEHAMSAENHVAGRNPCTAIDLSDSRPFAVYDFLRLIARAPTMDHVLHLHGTHDQPVRAVLAREDYARHYGDVATYDDDEVPMQRALDLIPRKVVWALLVTYPTLFVGSSLDDPALRYILGITSADFKRGRYLDHFAIVGARSDEDRERLAEQWFRHGITPIFYRIVESEKLGADHSNLISLVSDLGSSLGLDLKLDPIGSFTDRMLQL